MEFQNFLKGFNGILTITSFISHCISRVFFLSISWYFKDYKEFEWFLWDFSHFLGFQIHSNM